VPKKRFSSHFRLRGFLAQAFFSHGRAASAIAAGSHINQTIKAGISVEAGFFQTSHLEIGVIPKHSEGSAFFVRTALSIAKKIVINSRLK
jgi:hypothetical protein